MSESVIQEAQLNLTPQEQAVVKIAQAAGMLVEYEITVYELFTFDGQPMLDYYSSAVNPDFEVAVREARTYAAHLADMPFAEPRADTPDPGEEPEAREVHFSVSFTCTRAEPPEPKAPKAPTTYDPEPEPDANPAETEHDDGTEKTDDSKSKIEGEVESKVPPVQEVERSREA